MFEIQNVFPSLLYFFNYYLNCADFFCHQLWPLSCTCCCIWRACAPVWACWEMLGCAICALWCGGMLRWSSWAPDLLPHSPRQKDPGGPVLCKAGATAWCRACLFMSPNSWFSVFIKCCWLFNMRYSKRDYLCGLPTTSRYVVELFTPASLVPTQEMFPVSPRSTAEMVSMLCMSRRFSPLERTLSSIVTFWGQKEEIKSGLKLHHFNRENSKMPHTDRLGGIFPGDIIVEVRVVGYAANIEFLPNNTHIFICVQEDIWRETKFWSERKL